MRTHISSRCFMFMVLLSAGICGVQQPAAREGLFDLMELCNTSLHLAGALNTIPTDRYIDGIDQTSFLLADNGASHRDKVYIWNEYELMAMRIYEYQIYVKVVQRHAQWLNIDMTTVRDVGLAPWLFNLYTDPKEEDPSATA